MWGRNQVYSAFCDQVMVRFLIFSIFSFLAKSCHNIKLEEIRQQTYSNLTLLFKAFYEEGFRISKKIWKFITENPVGSLALDYGNCIGKSLINITKSL